MKYILVVEDTLELQRMYDRALTAAGYEVASVGTADKAAASVEEKKPDLILLDIMLPGGKNGFDFLEKLKKDEETKKIPVIVLTNLDSEENVAREIGAVDYIVKANVAFDQLIARIQKVLPS